MRKHKYENILTSLDYCGLGLKNKIFMSSMNRCRASKVSGAVTEFMKLYYQQRANAGIIFTEPIYINKQGITNQGSSYWTEDNLEGWKQLVSIVKEKDGVIFATLSHGGRVTHPEINGGKTPLAPSAVKPNIHLRAGNKILDPVTPIEMTDDDIKYVLEEFHNVAQGVKKAGFDGISLHGSSGCLVENFIKSKTNLRKDIWGDYGGLQFPVEILKRFKNEFNQSFISIKINPYDEYNDMYECKPLEKYSALVDKIMQESPIGLFELKEAYEKGHEFSNTQNKGEQVRLKNAEIAKKIKSYKNCKLISNFGSKNIDDGLYLINQNYCDFLSCATFFVSNPDLPKKISQGLPLVFPEENLYYTDGPRGYIDYI
jgi:N-ethylmaleimide reductase